MKKAYGVMFLLIGIVSVILGMVSFSMETGSYELNVSYGGDAYTGIQNASAQAANNIIYLAEVTSFGFGAVLTVAGVFMMIFGIKTLSAPEQQTRQVQQETEEKPVIQEVKPAEKPVEAMPVNTPMWWQCSCGKTNHSSVKTCQCGASRK